MKRRSAFPAPSAERAGVPDAAVGLPDPPVLQTEHGGVHVLRDGAHAVPGLAEVALLAQVLASAPGEAAVATVVVGAFGPVSAALWTRLGGLLDTLCEGGRPTVRLVVSGAGRTGPDGPALAQRVADTWELDVIAPDGTVLFTPGGSLFVPEPEQPRGGWLLFRAGREPRLLGPRQPAPAWQASTADLPVRTVSGYRVEQIPAGVLLRPQGVGPLPPEDLCLAVQPDPDRLTVVVGAPGSAAPVDVPPDDLAALLAALPTPVRGRACLVSGTDRDLLPTARSVADSLGAEVELLSGLPLLTDADPDGPSTVRQVLVDAQGDLTWQPWVESVACGPAGSLRVLQWRTPVPDTGADTVGDGAVRLSDDWQVNPAWAGLALGPTGRALPLWRRAVQPGQLAVEVGVPGEPLAESGYQALAQLLLRLESQARPFVVLYGPGGSPDEERRLRRLAVEHGVRMVWPLPGEPASDVEPAPALPAALGSESAVPDSAAYLEIVTRIVGAASSGRHDSAFALAQAFEREAHHDHGADSAAFLQARQLHAHVARLAGRQAQAADLYRQVALALLDIRGAVDADIEQAAGDADACWREIADRATARRTARSVLALLRRVPGPDGRRLHAAQHHRVQLYAPSPLGTASAPDADSTGGRTPQGATAPTPEALAGPSAPFRPPGW